MNATEDALLRIKKNDIKKPYYVIIVAGLIFIILNIISTILICRVKDVNKYGIKFECISVSACIIITNIINIILQNLLDNNKPHHKTFINIFNVTKGGKLLYAFISLYMFFASISLPTLNYIKAKSLKNKYYQDPMCSIEYFYKVLNTPTLVGELRDIAIKQFSVENVLFWENYQILQKMSKEYQIENKRKIRNSNNDNNNNISMKQYNFESYYKQQMDGYQKAVPNDNVSFDSTLPIPQEHIRYFTLFYHM
ncbi:hypothetical protein PIROE2DRAFT_7988 [Piromyces sp. E2]|nr:hypothetical protein PIROE2DRAFT_7988 [Piromyces sp. E2]|eukprot:OUM65098.1 hypothetical protein PIROE2DRAFT_7988 [Piromyces sp. E2]